EVTLFAGAVEALEAAGHSVDFARLFDDIRASIDESHQDGSILDAVLADLPGFIAPDPQLGDTLHKLRSAGKRLFLLTNSQPAYTERVMEHLLPPQWGEYGSWRRYFDLVVTGAQKPRFFLERRPFFEAGASHPHEGRLEREQLYFGGNIEALHAALGVDGDRVLYVGDHIYGDVLRAKKAGRWRPARVSQEMDHGLAVLEGHGAERRQLDQLGAACERAERAVHEQRGRLRALQLRLEQEEDPQLRAALSRERRERKRALEQRMAERRTHGEARDALERELHNRFHPFWGPIFKAGVELSSFGDQVE